MILRKNLFFLITIYIIGCMGCSVSAPTVHTVESVRLAPSSNSLDVLLTVHIENPNNFTIRVPKLSFDVQLDETDLGNASARPRLKMKPLSSQVYPITLSTTVSSLVGLVLNGNSLFSKRGATLHLDGFIKGRVFIFSKKVRIQQSYPIQL